MTMIAEMMNHWWCRRCHCSHCHNWRWIEDVWGFSVLMISKLFSDNDWDDDNLSATITAALRCIAIQPEDICLVTGHRNICLVTKIFVWPWNICAVVHIHVWSNGQMYVIMIFVWQSCHVTRVQVSASWAWVNILSRKPYIAISTFFIAEFIGLTSESKKP